MSKRSSGTNLTTLSARLAFTALIALGQAGCATVLGVSGAGIDSPASAATLDICTADTTGVLTRWGEISGSLLLRSVRGGGGLDSGVVQLGSPTDVAAGPSDVYILDAALQQILAFDRNTQAVRRRISVPGLNARGHIYVDRAQSVYVSNPSRAEVVQFDLDGRVLQVFSSADQLSDPGGLAVSNLDGRVYVADGLSARIVVFTPQGAISDVIGAQLPVFEQLQSISGIAVAPDQLFVVDGMAGKVHFLSGTGGYRYSFGDEQLSNPGAIAVDAENRVFVADNGDGSIKVFRGGELISVVGGRNDPDRIHFEQVAGLSYSNGMLYVADSGTVSIKIFGTASPCL